VTNNTVAALKAGQVNHIHFMSGSMPEEGQSYMTSSLFFSFSFSSSLISADWKLGCWERLLRPMLRTSPQRWNRWTCLTIRAWWPVDILESGLWNNGSNPINTCEKNRTRKEIYGGGNVANR
jgi:hypothetical protein